MNYVFPMAPAPALPVIGSDKWVPVRRIFCVGRNYADHAREMGVDPSTSPPFFFTKPGDALVQDGAIIPYAQATNDLQFEIELVSVIGKEACNISAEAAGDHIFGYATGLDMTRRDLQTASKKTNQPWDMGKGFDDSAPCSAIRPAAEVGNPRAGRIVLKRNGEIVQDSDLSHQIWHVHETVAYLSSLIRLMPGDLIFHGTPEGVGPVIDGDELHGAIEGVGDIKVKFGPPR